MPRRCRCCWASCGSPDRVQGDPATTPPSRSRTRPAPPAPTAVCCASGAPPPSSPNAPTRSVTGNDAAPPAGAQTLDAETSKARNVVERAFAHIKQWRGLATRYDEHVLIYRGALDPHSIIRWLNEFGDTPWTRPGVSFTATQDRGVRNAGVVID